MDERLIAAVAIRVLLMAAATYNLRLAVRERRHYADARALRGLVAAITMFAGTTALTTSSPVISAYLGIPSVLAVLTGASVMVFLAGLVFSCYSWRLGR